MSIGRAGTATVLKDGSVLFVGGADTLTAEIYVP